MTVRRDPLLRAPHPCSGWLLTGITGVPEQFLSRRHRRLRALLQYEALHGGRDGLQLVHRSCEPHTKGVGCESLSRWRVLRDPRYLRFAVSSRSILSLKWPRLMKRILSLVDTPGAGLIARSLRPQRQPADALPSCRLRAPHHSAR